MNFRGEDLTGNVYNRLTVIGISHKVGRKVYWDCVCECGNKVKVRSDCLKCGDVKSCKCLNYEASSIKHNQANTKLYHVYYGMKSRCYNEKAKHYNSYGGRGIIICDEWLDDYMNFYNWSIGNGYKEGLSIDRINVNGNYEPTNCRWITNQSQQLNKRTNVYYTYNGDTKTIKEWTLYLGVSYNTFYNRLRKFNKDITKTMESFK